LNKNNAKIFHRPEMKDMSTSKNLYVCVCVCEHDIKRKLARKSRYKLRPMK